MSSSKKNSNPKNIKWWSLVEEETNEPISGDDNCSESSMRKDIDKAIKDDLANLDESAADVVFSYLLTYRTKEGTGVERLSAKREKVSIETEILV